MSNVQAVTMQELELETAELLPNRETLNCCRTHPGSTSVTQVNNGNIIGSQLGLLNLNVAALNGNALFL